MSPLFTDTLYEPTSPGSLSPEGSYCNTAGSEREGDEKPVGKMGTKRREKNREAARKTRRKQTERADELHEELQRLEQSNSALEKEIAALKKERHCYTTVLANHEPNCHIKASTSGTGSTSHLSLASSAKCRTNSSSPRTTLKASSSSLATNPSVSTSSSSSLTPQIFDCVENTPLSTLASALTHTTVASSSGSSTKLYQPSMFSTLPAPHSLFHEESPITSKPANVMPVCTSFFPNTVHCSTLTTVAQSGQNTIDETTALNSDILDVFLNKQTPFLPTTSNVLSPYTQLVGELTECKGATHEAPPCPVNAPQLHPGQNNENPNTSTLLSSLLTPPVQDPALQPLTASPQTNMELLPAPAFPSKPTYRQQISPNQAPLLSLLTIPSPLVMSPQTTSTSSVTDGLTCQPPPSVPLLGYTSGDSSLSELLEFNDWILNNNQ